MYPSYLRLTVPEKGSLIKIPMTKMVIELGTFVQSNLIAYTSPGSPICVFLKTFYFVASADQ